MGPIYDSVLHLLASPESLAPVLGLALLAGLRGARQGRWALFAVTGAWFVGAAAGFAPASGTVASLAPAGVCLVLGSLVAADLPIPLGLTVALAAAVGFLSGAMEVAAQGPGRTVSGLAGACATVFVLSALVASIIVPLRILWLRIAVRVAGSWLAALGLLLVGWAVRR
jgi:hypothetical protein